MKLNRFKWGLLTIFNTTWILNDNLLLNVILLKRLGGASCIIIVIILLQLLQGDLLAVQVQCVYLYGAPDTSLGLLLPLLQVWLVASAIKCVVKLLTYIFLLDLSLIVHFIFLNRFLIDKFIERIVFRYSSLYWALGVITSLGDVSPPLFHSIL